jgi:kynurenine 3-monooxygenase
MNDKKDHQKRITVIGGGLVGSMVSCFLARRGFAVDVFDMRCDPRATASQSSYTAKSINLALSERGRSALRALGLEQEIISDHSIPMKGRLIHDTSGRKRVIPYGQEGQCIFSVDRRFLNQRLLDCAEQEEGVRLFFDHKLISCDLRDMRLDFIVNDKTSRKTISTETVIGADGAYSAVRKSLMKVTRVNYSQEYIDHGYLELCIPCRDDDYAMEANYLHIWPRGDFMMIALPNLDKSFTVTLFMPFERFEAVTSRQQLIRFFSHSFPDALDLIGRDNLCHDFLGNKPSSLVSIKCSPIHFEGRGLLIGDAAHAMVPFFGQGMNCGFEDCLILDSLMTPKSATMERVFALFEQERNIDHHVMCDLAMYNYLEMRHLVNSWSFLLRKKTDLFLNRLFPQSWLSLYQMITFSRIPVKECLDRKRYQDTIVSWTTRLTLMTTSLVIGLLVWRRSLSRLLP